MTPQEKYKQQFTEQYREVHAKFLRYCEVLTGEPESARDLLSDSVLVTLENYHKIKKKDAFLSYLIGVARNRFSKHLRHKNKWESIETGRVGDAQDSGADPSLQADVRFLHEALNQLPEKQREALILFELSGFSQKEIQAIQGDSLSAVKARIVRGREALKQLLIEKKSVA
ncbi:RNA polymerase sigma factor [bacterium SCSIO 12741]|nr:RNA polymerase sigma factor [bacterium SCSIO 12741]